MARRIGWICLAFSVFAIFAETSQAQVWLPAARVVQTPLRYLGHGNGHGYHHRNPGPDVSYYNPWSQKNSFLISRSPEFLARYGHELHRSPMEILQYGNNTWGQPTHFSQPSSSIYQGVAPLNADFVPTKAGNDGAKVADETDDKKSGGDFQTDSSEEVEDRFEEEADAIDSEVGDDEAVGGFESLKDAVKSSPDAAVLLTPAGRFRPASHSIGN